MRFPECPSVLAIAAKKHLPPGARNEIDLHGVCYLNLQCSSKIPSYTSVPVAKATATATAGKPVNDKKIQVTLDLCVFVNVCSRADTD